MRRAVIFLSGFFLGSALSVEIVRHGLTFNGVGPWALMTFGAILMVSGNGKVTT